MMLMFRMDEQIRPVKSMPSGVVISKAPSGSERLPGIVQVKMHHLDQ